MNVSVRFTDGSTQQSFDVPHITIEDGEVRLGNRALPLSRIQFLTSATGDLCRLPERSLSPTKELGSSVA